MAKSGWTRIYGVPLFDHENTVILAEIMRSPSDITFFQIRKYEKKNGWLKALNEGVVLRIEEFVTIYNLSASFTMWSGVSKKLDEVQGYPKMCEKQNWRRYCITVIPETDEIFFETVKRYNQEIKRSSILVKKDWLKELFIHEFTPFEIIAQLWSHYENGRDAEMHQQMLAAVIEYHIKQEKCDDEPLVDYDGWKVRKSQKEKHELLEEHPPIYDYRLGAAIFPLREGSSLPPIRDVINGLAMKYAFDADSKNESLEWTEESMIRHMMKQILDYQYNKKNTELSANKRGW